MMSAYRAQCFLLLQCSNKQESSDVHSHEFELKPKSFHLTGSCLHLGPTGHMPRPSMNILA